jgi:hypothetical protein
MGVYNNIKLGINIRWPCKAINKYSIALHIFYRIHDIFVSRGHQKRIDFDSTVATTATSHTSGGAKYKKDGILRKYSDAVDVVCVAAATTTVPTQHRCAHRHPPPSLPIASCHARKVPGTDTHTQTHTFTNKHSNKLHQ